jgi:hypothetical protein
VAFATRREAFAIKYAAAVEEQGKHTNLIDEVTRLTAELQSAESIQSRARMAENSKATAETAYLRRIRLRMGRTAKVVSRAV